MQLKGGGQGGAASSEIESKINSAKGGGQPLAPDLQGKMGEAMGADFSGVKVHTNPEADQLNHSLQAKAFATGQDVFFRQGAYAPQSRSGQELIAHELTHVVQQGGAGVQKKSQQNKVSRKEVSTPKSEVLTHLQSLKGNGNHDPAIYRQEIEKFKKGNSINKAAEKSQSTLESGNGEEQQNPQLQAKTDSNHNSEKTPTLIRHSSIGSEPIQRYFLAENPNDPSDLARISDDSSAAVKQRGSGSHMLWAAPGKAQHSSNQLKAVKSAIRLFEDKTDLLTVFGLDGREKRLVRVIPRNLRNNTQGNNMVTWADCGKAAWDVIGARNSTRGVYKDPAGQTRQRKRTVEVGNVDAIKWKVLEDMLRVHERQLGRKILDERKISFMKNIGNVDGLAYYFLKVYNSLPPQTRENLDRRTGINRWANPSVGQAYTTSTGGSLVTDRNGNEIEAWNFHWAGVVMKSDNGRDNITLENYGTANPRAVNTNWEFQMYGSAYQRGQTFHEEHKATGTHGTAPTTFVAESSGR
ncbi:MAG: DUF4157 domain-containing protein [Spirulinaceae cyanobacterium]